MDWYLGEIYLKAWIYIYLIGWTTRKNQKGMLLMIPNNSDLHYRLIILGLKKKMSGSKVLFFYLPSDDHRSWFCNTINTLSCIKVTHTFFEHCVGLESSDGIPYSSWWQAGFFNNCFLRKGFTCLQYLVHQFRGWWEMLDLSYLNNSSLFRGKNDPFWS